MKEKLVHIWRDPVWSKVIAAVIVAIGGLFISAIKSMVSGLSFKTAVLNVLCFKVSIWVVLSAVFVVVILVALIKKYSSKPVPPFVTDFTSGVYQNQQWQWRWRWSEVDGYYYIDELDIMCPKCKTGVLNLGFSDYRCGNCGEELDFERLGVDSIGVRKQIMLDTRKSYPQYAGLVGEFY